MNPGNNSYTSSSPPKIAVVNDEPVQLEMIAAMLREQNSDINLFSSAELALESFSEHGPPDLIITDLYMPGIDGWKFCRLLRSAEFPDTNKVPIMILSGTYSNDDSGKITAELGANAFLPSPVDFHEFIHQVQLLLKGESVTSLPAVLIVEDSKSLIAHLENLFRSNGYSVKTVMNGQEALISLESQTFDLAVLDYHLPDIHGDRILDALKLNQPDTVCVMITTDPRPDLATMWMKAGAAAYVRKPFDPEYLLQVCETARRERALLRVEDILERRTREILDSQERSSVQRSAIARMALDQDIISSELERALPAFTRVCAETVRVTRCGIWFLSIGDNVLRCDSLYDTSLSQHTSGLDYDIRYIPEYFQSVHDESRICAEDALNDPRTNELAANYLASLGITSVLHAGIISQGRLLGVLCLEHAGQRRKWHSDEEAFAGTVAAMIAQAVVNSEHNLAISALRKSEEKYRQIFENAPVGIFQTTSEGRFLSVNPAYSKLAGYDSPEQMIRLVTDISKQIYADPEVRDHYKQELARYGFVNNYEAELLRRDGSSFWVSMNTTAETLPDGSSVYSGFLSDITERKSAEAEQSRLESQLRHAQKMEALGTLAGGIAHDFNNILQAIIGYSQLLLAGKSPDDPDYKALSHIDNYSDRAKSLITQMLAFSRRMDSTFQRMDLNQEILETHKILVQTLPRMVRIELGLDNTLLPVSADPIQIQQVLLNLGSNAADAMPDGGTLAITTRNVFSDTEILEFKPDPDSSAFVLMSVSDTGSGMDEHTRSKAFDPFYTTKPVSKGTGLGLASVYGIVKSHGGNILCFSTPGHGTRFKIYFPALAEDEEIAHDVLQTEQILEGTETILVVDDEAPILELTSEFLENCGYRVLCCSTGEEAIDLYQDNKDLCLVLLDLNMPGIGGMKCLQKLISLDPDARVVITSGYTGSGLAEEMKRCGASAFISKPYKMKELAVTVRKVLDDR